MSRSKHVQSISYAYNSLREISNQLVRTSHSSFQNDIVYIGEMTSLAWSFYTDHFHFIRIILTMSDYCQLISYDGILQVAGKSSNPFFGFGD